MNTTTTPGGVLGWLRRFSFRFFTAFLVLINLRVIISLIPGSKWAPFLYWPWSHFLSAYVPWFGRHVLHQAEPMSTKMTGSGDALYQWVMTAGVVGLALAAGLIWVWFDRTRRHDAVVRAVLLVLVRYVLAYWLLLYGCVKIFSTQFPPPGIFRLMETYGQSSPMGLMWTFMGFSKGYELFAGLMEVIPGVLLLFRRTSSLGAALAAGVMTNVFLMNMFFDVPVKLFSGQLLLFAVFLLAFDLKRLLAVLVFNHPTEPRDLTPYWSNPALRWTALGLKVLVIASILYSTAFQSWQRGDKTRVYRPELAIAGGFEVVSIRRGEKEVTPVASADPKAWQRLTFRRGFLFVDRLDRSVGRYEVRAGKESGHLVIKATPKDAPEWEFTYEPTGKGEWKLVGPVENQPTELKLKALEQDPFLLENRGFHWITEKPFNQ